jgi:HEAT repeat protein
VLLGVCLLAFACSSSDEDEIRAQVTILVNHEGAQVTAAAEMLAKKGRRAIPTVEAALHTAAPPARKNLILALRKIGDVEAVPLLGHLASYDPSAEVRREAEWTLKLWAGESGERAERARDALRSVDERRSREAPG